MNTKTSIIALTLLATSSAACVANANETAVSQIVTSMVKQAVSSVSQEIDTQIDKTVLTANHLLSVNGEQVLGTVTITDLVATTTEKSEVSKEEQKGE
ncbi:hypothetical protein KJ365_09595 [Glaciecola sp. XM2]|uniref:hypothetical protein n=1 Tax=Glaciecola sp. XM2 TaxID=1914931 RepID=UPI001BDEC2F8|nr:hypothetical protein [Glaciecola sp. XM2]MBT1451133.1 hypothetical protein [Glaciecola sp. XM2]